MAKKINVIGASGQLGKKVVRSLLDQGVSPDDIIVSVRDPHKMADIATSGIDVRHADYEDGELLEKAFEGTDTLLIIPSTAPVEPRIIQLHNAVNAAGKAGVRRIVLSSICSAKPDSVTVVAPFYLYGESKVRTSGMQWTIMRNNLYIDPVADWVPELVKMGRLPYPMKGGRVAYVSRKDLARAIAAACIRDDLSGRIFELTGAEAISMDDLGRIISDLTKMPVRFESVSEEEYVSASHAGEMDIPEYKVDVLVSIYRAVENGEFANVTGHIEDLTGKPPEKVGEYMKRRLRVKK